MATKPKNEYKKLSSGRYWFRNVSLWMGKDHLLLRESMGYSEDYKRFYYRDIQAVLIRRHTQRLLWGLFWGAVLALFLTLMATSKDYANVGLWICAGPAILIFIVNFVLGPGCICRLKTAVQLIELPITRLNKANKILAKLKPLIEAAQANLPIGPAPVPVQPDPLTSNFSRLAGPSGPIKPLKTDAHWVLFILLFLNAALNLSRFFTLDLVWYLIQFVSGYGLIIPMIFAMVRQSNSDASSAIRRATMFVMIFVISGYFLGLIWGTSLGLQHPQMARDQWAIIKLGASISPYKSTFAMVDLVFDLAGNILCGSFLLSALLSFSRARAAASRAVQEAP